MCGNEWRGMRVTYGTPTAAFVQRQLQPALAVAGARRLQIGVIYTLESPEYVTY
jgi:hypothetical protein